MALSGAQSNRPISTDLAIEQHETLLVEAEEAELPQAPQRLVRMHQRDAERVGNVLLRQTRIGGFLDAVQCKTLAPVLAKLAEKFKESVALFKVDADADPERARIWLDDPDDLDARYRLGARKVMSGDFEAALEQLFEIMRRNRGFGEDTGRKGMLSVV